jgi:predicted nucleotidyltransferase
MKRGRRLDRRILQDIVRRVVRVTRPERIILFGSAARGEMSANSDVDLLVVKRGKFHRGRLTGAVYMALLGAGAAVDVVIATPEELERYKDAHCTVIAPALETGVVVYGS